MGAVQIIATIVAAAITAVAAVLGVRAVVSMTAVIRIGQPDHERFTDKGRRLRTMLKETVGHTRMLRWGVVGASHWFVMVSFVLLSSLVLEAYFEVVKPDLGLPLIGDWSIYGFATEFFGVFGFIGILILMGIRLANRPGSVRRRSRFQGSTMWQAYYVEYTILAVLICGFLIRGLKAANGDLEFPVWAAPVSHALGDVLPHSEAAVSLVAMVKILVSMAWVIVIATHVTMGIAWHRFAAFFNIFFKRDPGGPGSGLGALRPMTSGGAPLDFEEADPEKDQSGVAQV